MTHVEQIITQFGGLSAMAKALGHKNPTTVQGWKNANKIPDWRFHEIEKAAEEQKISLPKLEGTPK